MASVAPLQKKFTLLESGKEFFGDFFEALDGAQETVLIKQFLWRNDATGRKVAERLLACLERGVKVFIVKDRMGAFYEYGEGDGQSFFHDEPLRDSFFALHSLATVYLQAHFLFSRFYKNSVCKQIKNPLRAALVNHPLARVMDAYKLYDHSKIVVIDGRLAYLGGVGFADEFNEAEGKWLDYMVKMTDAASVQELMYGLAGEPNSFRMESYTRILEVIHEAKEELVIEMPFVGHPAYIGALVGAAERGVEVHLNLPLKAPSHHYRNLHFLKTLFRRAGRDAKHLHVALSPRIVHGKSIVSDGKLALFGSQNLHMDPSVLREMTLETADGNFAFDLRERLLEPV